MKVTDPDVLERIKALAVPPAWTDVWICPWPNGHIQALGTDVAGRRQYRYHDDWRKARDQEKFERLLQFGYLLPSFRQTVASDISMEGMPLERVCATAARLLDDASLRVGGEEYAEDNETYGIATLLKSHARLRGEEVEFSFTAKSQKEVRVRLADPSVTEVLRVLKHRRGGGPELLAWKDKGCWRDVRSQDINEYIKAGTGAEFSAKDFRTWNATVLATVYLAEVDPSPIGERARRKAVSEVVKRVSEHLGNTPSVCRKSYVDPRAIDFFHRGDCAVLPRGRSPKREDLEAAVLCLLDLSKDSRKDHPIRIAA